MSKDTLSLEDQALVSACRGMAASETFTIPALVDLLGRMPSLVQSLKHRAATAEEALRHERSQNEQARAALVQRVEVAERHAARAECSVDSLSVRVMELSRPDHGLTIFEMVHDAYETARDKGWHDPADEDDVTVVKVRRRLCGEGIRTLALCRIAEMLRKGEEPKVEDYLRLFTPTNFLLSKADERLVADLMLVITEVGEAIEDVVYGRLEEARDEKGKPTGLPSELADIEIRVAHICGHRRIDLDGAVQRKLAFNKTRPRKHGRLA